MSTKSRPLQERFEEKVAVPEDPTQCWIWTGSKKSDGYGKIGLGAPSRDTVLAHRAAWMIYRYPIPDGMLVLHTCNNGAGGCVNPDHLYIGDYCDNTKDRVRAGNNATQKLTVEDVAAIRVKLEAGHTGIELAEEYNISRTAISRIRTGRTFKNM